MMTALILAGCAASGGGGVYHTVAKGQTLYSIGRAYNIDPDRLARINGIKDPTRLQSGDQLYLPDAKTLVQVSPTALPATRTSGKVSTVPPPKPLVVETAGTETRTKASPKVNQATKTPQSPIPASSAATSNKPSSAKPSLKGRFIWPLKGKVVKGFGAQGENINKGLEIQARQGAPVLSAAAGKVIYSGDGITGFGNLIIVKHDDSIFTVYGYNAKNLVQTGAFVSQGQAIAKCGDPPRGGSPRLYFEIRNGKDPVNPIFYLP